MSNNIWNNPLMWQSKKSEKDDFEFNFDINFEPESLAQDFDDIKEGIKDIEQAFKDAQEELKSVQEKLGFVDKVAKVAEYKDTTPEMANTGNAPREATDTKERKVDKTQSDYLLNMIFGDTPLSEIPSLETLLGHGGYGGVVHGGNITSKINININIFNDDDDDETDSAMADKLGVTTADIFDKGVAAGLSPLDIVDNINVLRSALTLKEATDSKLNARDLIELYQASLNNDKQAGQSILDKNNIILDDGVSLNDIMSLMQATNNDLFKFAYLN